MRDGAKLYHPHPHPEEREVAAPDPPSAHALRREQEARQPGHEPPGRDPGPGVLRERTTTWWSSRTSADGSSRRATTSCTARRSGPSTRPPSTRAPTAWDTIDWLVKNVPANNGRVGLWGTSYPGWLTLAGLRDPHPALAAAVPFNPVVDAWKADDWFHWGAFRAVYNFDFIHAMESRKGQSGRLPLRELRPLPLGALAREPEPRPHGAARRAPPHVGAADRVPGLWPVLEVGRRRPMVRLGARSGWCPRSTCTASSTRRTSTAAPPSTRPSRPTTRPTT